MTTTTSNNSTRSSARSKQSRSISSNSRIIVEDWVCDVCKVAAFEDYDEACRHEETCCGISNEPSGKAQPNTQVTTKNPHPFFTTNIPKPTTKDNGNCMEKKPAPMFTLKTCETNTRRITRSSTSSSKENTAANIAPLFLNNRAASNTEGKQQRGLSKRQKEDEILSKKIQMAEQRTAEFMNKRRLEHEQDVLRRAAKKIQRKPVEEKITAADNQKEMSFSELLQPWLHRNAAPLFPVPSHFIPSNNYKTSCSGVSPAATTAYQPKVEFLVNKATLSSRSNILPTINTDIAPVATSQSLLYNDREGGSFYGAGSKKTTLLHEAFRSAFHELAKIGNRHIHRKSSQDIYQLLQMTPENVCGEVNKQVCQELTDYLKEWKQYYSMMKKKQVTTAKPKHTSKQQLKRSKYVDDFDSDDSYYEDEDGMNHVLILVGPTGCGKTQLVHSCASFLGSCHVLEINTSVPRGGTSLRRIMEEATQSQSLFLSSSQQYNNNATCKEIHGYDCNKEYDGRTDIANSSSCSMPVLLLDEVDILFDDDGDSGFWSAFKQLCKKAKVPIILTATDVPSSILSSNSNNNYSEMNNPSSYFRFKKLLLERPSEEECTEYLIARLYDMVQYPPTEKQQKKKIWTALSTASQLLNCDIRRCLLEMQTQYCIFQDEELNRLYNGSATVFSSKSFTKINYRIPYILDVQPKQISSKVSTVIKIVGLNFSCLLRQNIPNNLNDISKQKILHLSLTIGGRRCPFIVLRDDLIYAICPPCQPSHGVDDFGVFQKSLENCLSCSFPVLSFDFRHSAYGRLISLQNPTQSNDERLAFSFEQEQMNNLRYIFPDMGDRLDRIKKARKEIVFHRKNKMKQHDDLKRARLRKKTSLSERSKMGGKSTVQDQGDMASSDDDSEDWESFMKIPTNSESFDIVNSSTDQERIDSFTKSSIRQINTNDSASWASRREHHPVVEVTELKQMHGALLDRNTLKDQSMKTCGESEWPSQNDALLKAAASEYFSSFIESCDRTASSIIADVTTPERSSQCSALHEELCCLEELSHRCDLASVAELIDDYHSLIIVPDLAGAVPGFGFDLVGVNNASGQLTLGGNSKPPEFDRLYSTAWADRSFFHGCSETYCRRPMTIYERRLLSEASNRRSNALPSKVSKGSENELVADLEDGDAYLLSNRSSEDFFLPLHIPGPIASFPTLARSASLWAIEGCSSAVDNFVLEALLHFKRYRRAKELISKELKLLFPDEAIMCCYLSGLSHFDLSIDLDPPSCKGAEGYVDSRLTLDLFPLLRRMAKDEELKQREHMRQEEAGSQAEYRGRATRARKKNGPLHYFSVCANSNSIEEHEGRKLGENLVKLALC